MKIRIIPHSPERSEAVRAFNERMRSGGSKWGFYPEPTCDWLPQAEDAKVWREFHLAVDDHENVRGGYALKPQRWYINGEEHTVTDWQGPFSEGDIDNQFATMGLRMIRDMLKKQPLLYSWGHGGDGTPIVRLLRSMGWVLHPTPVCIYIVHPYSFFRQCTYTRTTRARRLAHDLAAISGAAWVATKAAHALQLAKHAAGRRSPRLRTEVEASFGPWANKVWERCKNEYSALAVRDADVMNRLLPLDGSWPEATRLRVQRDGVDIGWAAVRATQLKDDARFGSMFLGSVIDCIASPGDAADVIRAATSHLRDAGVDLIISNQAHPAWASGFDANGYFVLPNKRYFAMSPNLVSTLSPWETVRDGLHVTNLDGHGPHTM